MKSLKFYMTSNIGGGGGTVSRLLKYLPMFNDLPKRKIGILLNYNYLSFYKKEGLKRTKRMIFDKDKLEYLNDNKVSFYDLMCTYSSEDSKKLNKEFDVLLDSGSGKILADSIVYYDLNYNQSKKLIFDLVDDYINFASEKKSNFVIAMDYSYKNTYKNEEGKSKKYNDIISSLLNNTSLQNDLLLKSLNKISDLKSKTKLYAPIHGKDEKSFMKHYDSIRNLEINHGLFFSGFALGGLNIYRNRYGKEIVKILKNIRNLGETRDIHILGSAGIKKIIPLVYGGANSFDCHTPWRRANEGYEISIPLINENLDFCKSATEVFKNIPIQEIDIDTYNNGSPVSKKYNLKTLNNFIANKGKNPENFHLAKVLIYLYGIYQYSFILNRLEKVKSNDELKDLIERIPNLTLRKEYLDICV